MLARPSLALTPLGRACIEVFEAWTRMPQMGIGKTWLPRRWAECQIGAECPELALAQDLTGARWGWVSWN
ncbi:unnamed protein product [Camellia sinensis]